ncbi:MAG: hypothetical protein NZ772_16955 [Cyanobacteria bacterium]|nr:hypothetical protein [Cyanobacteriota bacterium]MDW8202716.1 hypothetical protein [Cyanobacteriota bacterium SKYGB_h_bin112]
MAPSEPDWLIPNLPTVVDLFAGYQLTREFYREVHDREEHQRYCQWYHQVAQQHRDELKHLRQDINLLGFFYRGRF